MSSRIFLGTANSFQNQAASFYPPPQSDSSHTGAAVVHALRAFGLQFFPRFQRWHSLRYRQHTNPLERQLRFRRALRLFRFGNIHSPGGASCKDSGGFLPPLQ
jgi:hypothetical protein